MEFSSRSISIGFFIALLVLGFTFATSVLTAFIQSYNLAVSVAFAMGGLFTICLSVILKKVHFLDPKGIHEDTGDK